MNNSDVPFQVDLGPRHTNIISQKLPPGFDLFPKCASSNALNCWDVPEENVVNWDSWKIPLSLEGGVPR